VRSVFASKRNICNRYIVDFKRFMKICYVTLKNDTHIESENVLDFKIFLLTRSYIYIHTVTNYIYIYKALLFKELAVTRNRNRFVTDLEIAS